MILFERKSQIFGNQIECLLLLNLTFTDQRRNTKKLENIFNSIMTINQPIKIYDVQLKELNKEV